MGCFPSKKSTERTVYVVETDIPELMSGGALHNEYETRRSYLDVYGRPPTDDTNSAAAEDEDPHSSSHKRRKHHDIGKHRKEDEGNEDFDADAFIEVDGPQTVNEKQTHTHSTV